MARSVGPGRDVVAYLILENYGGTMKGAGRPCPASAAIAPQPFWILDERLIFLLIIMGVAVQRSLLPRLRRKFQFAIILLYDANLFDDT